MKPLRGKVRISAIAVLGAVCAVAGLYLAKSDRLGPRPRRAQLLRVKLNGRAIDAAMFVDEAECRKFARRKDPKAAISVDFACVPEDDPSVPPEWKAPNRIVGKWLGCDVYYYHEPEPQTLAGAFVLALPNENDPLYGPVHYGDSGDPEISETFVDQRTCDESLAFSKGAWKSDLGLRRDAEHDPKLKAKNPSYEWWLKEEERAAAGACIPITSAMPLVNQLCEGLPLKLVVRLGEGRYECDQNIVKPQFLATQQARDAQDFVYRAESAKPEDKAAMLASVGISAAGYARLKLAAGYTPKMLSKDDRDALEQERWQVEGPTPREAQGKPRAGAAPD